MNQALYAHMNNKRKMEKKIKAFLFPSLSLFFFGGGWGLNSGLHTCKAGTLLFESHCQSILLGYFADGVL
jgi:hypothetical protein